MNFPHFVNSWIKQKDKETSWSPIETVTLVNCFGCVHCSTVATETALLLLNLRLDTWLEPPLQHPGMG